MIRWACAAMAALGGCALVFDDPIAPRAPERKDPVAAGGEAGAGGETGAPTGGGQGGGLAIGGGGGQDDGCADLAPTECHVVCAAACFELCTVGTDQCECGSAQRGWVRDPRGGCKQVCCMQSMCPPLPNEVDCVTYECPCAS